jgi:hypothetical protein
VVTDISDLHEVTFRTLYTTSTTTALNGDCRFSGTTYVGGSGPHSTSRAWAAGELAKRLTWNSTNRTGIVSSHFLSDTFFEDSENLVSVDASLMKRNLWIPGRVSTAVTSAIAPNLSDNYIGFFVTTSVWGDGELRWFEP